MKLFLFFCLISLCFFGQSTAAAIDTVVEQEKDSNQDDKSTILLDSIDQDCHQPRETGRCFALFYRYAFNAESLKCEEFIYGGCGGNKNNFEALDECERKCLKKEEDHTKSSIQGDNSHKEDKEDGITQAYLPT